MELYERLSGARMHASYIRPGGVAFDMPAGFLDDLFLLIRDLRLKMLDILALLSENRIWLERLSYIGTTPLLSAKTYSFSGVMLRGSGLGWDLRKIRSYEEYDKIKFQIPVGEDGDCYDRFLIRSEEVFQSLLIIEQVIEMIRPGDYQYTNHKIINPSRGLAKNTMESLIHHFKYYSEGLLLRRAMEYIATEAPKGEFGVYIASDGSNRPVRIYFRAPGFFHLQGLNLLTKGMLLSDLVTVIGTQDIVFGEIDR